MAAMKITREVTGTRSKSCSVIMDKDGKLLTKEEEQRTRWAEYFSIVLYRPDPKSSA